MTNPQFVAGGSVFGRTASQWNQYFDSKVDVNNGVLYNPTIIGTTSVTTPTLTTQKVTIAPPAGLSPALLTTQSLTGALAGNQNINWLLVSSDNMAITPTGPTPAPFGNPWVIEYHYGGAALQGNRNGFLVNGFFDGGAPTTNATRNYVGGMFQNTAVNGDGGGNGTERGAIFAASMFVKVASVNGYLTNASNEINLANLDATTKNISLLALVPHITHAAHASSEEAILHIGSQSAVPFKNGVTISSINGAFPFDTNTVFINFIGAQNLGTFLDTSQVTISGSLIKSKGLNVGGAGLVGAINNLMGVYPASMVNSWAVSDNFSSGVDEVNFWNCSNAGGGFDWRQKTGASASTQLAYLNSSEFATPLRMRLSQITTPGTPPTGTFYIWMDSSDHKLYAKGPSGTLTPLANP